MKGTMSSNQPAATSLSLNDNSNNDNNDNDDNDDNDSGNDDDDEILQQMEQSNLDDDDFFVDDYDPLESSSEDIEPFISLSGEILRSVTGEKDLSRVIRLEILFTTIHALNDLHLCPNLRELWITQTSLQSISNLSSLRYTLQSLCLADQKIRKIENLDELINLRELFLYSNEIEKIENLEGCTKLQRLWLNSNKIEVIENLECLVELKQLWLQDNKISKIPSLELPKLEEIALSGNKIVDLKSIASLHHLPSLRILSFNDNLHFLSPIAKLDGYKTFILFHLAQVQTLDFQPIAQRDRDKVQELYEKSQRVLQENMATLRQDTKNRLSENNAKKNGSKTTKEFQKKLEDRDRKRQQLETTLNDLKKKYSMEVNRLLQREYNELEVEMKHYSSQKGASSKNKNDLLSLLQGSGMKIQELDKQNTEYQFVCNHFRISMNKEKGGFGIHEVLKIDSPPSVDSKFSLSSNCKRMYLPVSRGNISQIVKSPIEGSTSSRGVTLYSTALQAHTQNTQTSRSLSTWLLLFCRVLMVSTLPQVFGSPKQRGTPLSFYETENTFQINNSELILPEYIIMYGKQDTFPMPLENRAQVDKYSILDNLEIQAESEFLKYKVSLWDNLQPDVVDKIHKNESNLQKLKAELLVLKQKIREERSVQEEILRNFRNKLP